MLLTPLYQEKKNRIYIGGEGEPRPLGSTGETAFQGVDPAFFWWPELSLKNIHRKLNNDEPANRPTGEIKSEILTKPDSTPALLAV